MAERQQDDQKRKDQPGQGGQEKPKGQDEVMGDAALTEESAKDPDIDRSKTPGRDYDV
ncbi:hypothetical protein [Indioceanicola profundi]|uniref:hypothetical protein n=1 Tax=Indioceanicola profundi TaxID=2220096 RepID=UPI0013C4C94D|nr:hypothetical protein [Indioceanicola profundi]